MSTEEFFWRRAIVSASGIIYWAGVWILARRVRKQIGRSPNLKPRGSKEKILWVGWLLVILVWVGQSFVVKTENAWPGMAFFPALLNLPLFVTGIALVVGGYACTLWCYSAMGNTWRIGINRKIGKVGPMRFNASLAGAINASGDPCARTSIASDREPSMAYGT